MKLLQLALLLAIATSHAAANEYTWTAGSGSWSDPVKWEPVGVPGPGDVAIIPWGSHTIELTGDVNVGGLYMDGGVLDGPYDITVTGTMIWRRGTIRGEGNLITIPEGARLNIEGQGVSFQNAALLSHRLIENHGTITWQAGHFKLRNEAEVRNYGLFEFSSDGTFDVFPESSLTNEAGGVLRRTEGDGASAFSGNGRFRSIGTIEVQAGIMRMRLEGTTENTVRIDSAGVLELNAVEHVFTPGSDITGDGQLVFYSRTTRFERDIVLPPVTRFQGGTIQGPVHFTIPPDAKLIIEDGGRGRWLRQVTITNEGTILWEDSRDVRIRETVLNNHGLFEMRGNGSFVRLVESETHVVHNHEGAVIRRSGSDGTAAIGRHIVFVNEGLTEIASGQLAVDTGNATGTFSIQDEATLHFHWSSAFDLDPDGVIEGQGDLLITGGELIVSGNYNLQGETRLTGGRITFANPPENPGVRQVIDGGTLIFEQPGRLTDVHLNGGTLTGPGEIDVTDSFHWSRGDVRDGASVTIMEQATLLIDGPYSRGLRNAQLHNYGSGVIAGERSFHLYFYTTAKFVNHGTLEIDTDAHQRIPFTVPQGGGVDNHFKNMEGATIYMKGSNALELRSYLYFHNYGDLIIDEARFIIEGWAGNNYFTHHSGRIVLRGGEFNVSRVQGVGGGVIRINDEVVMHSGSLEGYGTVNADIVSHGLVRPGFSNEPGILDLNGAYWQTEEGILEISINGYVAGETFSQLHTYEADVAGTLNVIIDENLSPQDDDSFRILSWRDGEPGSFDQVHGLELPDGRTLRLHQSARHLFVQGPQAVQVVFVEIKGRTSFRRDRPQTYSVIIGNNSDEFIVAPVVLWFPEEVTFELLFDIVSDPLLEHDDPEAEAAIRAIPYRFDDGDGGTVIPFLAPLNPGQQVTRQVRAWSNPQRCVSEPETFGRVRIGPPPAFWQQLGGCTSELVQTAVNFLPGGPCVSLVTGAATDAFLHFAGDQLNAGSVMASLGLGAARCFASFTPFGPIVQTSIFALDQLAKANRGMDLYQKCGRGYVPLEGSGETFDSDGHVARCVAAFDPNEKVGAGGIGDAGFIRGRTPISYTIFFENVDTVQVPAQDVFVTDRLDPARWDLSTFSLGQITFGDWVVDVPQGLSEYTTTVDLRPQMELLVGIEAALNKATGDLYWGLRSLDPDTGELTEDPLIGFLLPNVTPPEGDGSVSFTVLPNQDLASGTELLNVASIVFDTNEPIITNTWRNTIDRSPPSSHVLPLTETTGSPFEVRWVGEDDFSGTASYTIYLSVNGGPFSPWLVDTTSTSAAFDGQIDNQYAFYSIARDHVGNIERSKFEPEALTGVVVSTGTDDHPHVFALHANYPNPFNPSTRIRFSLAEAGPTRLVVYNVIGQRVAVLLDEVRYPGGHELVWDASRMSSGAYFVRLEQGDNLQTRKLMLLK